MRNPFPPFRIQTLRICFHPAVRQLAERANKLGDIGTNDMVVSDVLRANELQVWFVSEHLVNEPLVEAERDEVRKSA